MSSKEELAQLIKTVLNLQRGTWLIITLDQKAQLIEGKPNIELLRRALSTPERKCECMDTINLELVGAGRVRGSRIVMMVDDTGMLDGLPVNDLAFYIANTIKAYPHDIHGTAVIVNDEDFA
jgi:hypothetical protein